MGRPITAYKFRLCLVCKERPIRTENKTGVCTYCQTHRRREYFEVRKKQEIEDEKENNK